MTPSRTHTTVDPVRYGGSVRPKLPTQTPSTSVMAFLGPCFWKLLPCARLSPLAPSAATAASAAAYRNIKLMRPPSVLKTGPFLTTHRCADVFCLGDGNDESSRRLARTPQLVTLC